MTFKQGKGSNYYGAVFLTTSLDQSPEDGLLVIGDAEKKRRGQDSQETHQRVFHQGPVNLIGFETMALWDKEELKSLFVNRAGKVGCDI
jgi:hypothetical protein